MKVKMVRSDGFETNVAEKMPRIKKEEVSLPPNLEIEPQPLKDEHQEMEPSEELIEKKIISSPQQEEKEKEKSLGVSQLIEDLHTQLLVLGRTKRALEIDLTASQKSIYQLGQDNKDLQSQIEVLKKEIQRLKENQTESIYLKEENEDALERIREFQLELRTLKEDLTRTTQQRDEALSRIHDLESKIEQNELLQIKGKLKEREASHYFEENRELRLRLEETQARNMELEKKYEELRQSFNEVRESLTLLRDSCKANYYNLSPTQE